MTHSDEDRLETLKYRLLAPSTDLGSWGHEYMRHLALEIGQEYQNRLAKDEDSENLIALVLSLVPFFLSHNAEADAVDILSEMEMIEKIKDYLDENAYARVCLYMVSMVPLLTYPYNDEFLRTAHDVYLQYKQLPQAITLAIRLNDMELIKADFAATKDKTLRRQLAMILARQRVPLVLSEEEKEEDDELESCLYNTKLHEHFKFLAKELNILDPKVPEDIYKSHLESSRTAGLTNTDSARHNLASAFVNAFVNAGFGADKLMLTEGSDKQTNWIWKTKDEGMMSTTASLGMLMLWDVEAGLDKIDRYGYAQETHIKAGAALATGIISSGVRAEGDPTLALLSEFTSQGDIAYKVSSIMGLGIAYAGSGNEDVCELLLPFVTDTSIAMQLSAMAALSL
ncbi:hypothetical protein LTR28_000756, partial [Elasticomyces elasticus]